MACTRSIVLTACVLSLWLVVRAAGQDDPPRPPNEPDRSERVVVINSRVLLLIDTSASMGLWDGERGPTKAARTRIQEVADALAGTDFLTRLRRKHEVVVYRFDESLRRAVELPKLANEDANDKEPGDAETLPDKEPKTAEKPVRWREVLAATGMETRLGDAVRKLIEAERNSPISGIILCSDGCQNAGVSVDDALEGVRDAGIPIVTIGVGSNKLPVNVGILDLAAPARVMAGDSVRIVGYVTAEGMANQTVTVELLLRAADNGAPAEPGSGRRVASSQVALGDHGEVMLVEFEIQPESPGRRTYCLRLAAPDDDGIATDNVRETDIFVADRRSRVLLLAGGPTREYRFLSNLLYRDRSTTLDVLLQTAGQGTSQAADRILADFPETREEMFAYDCVVAIDPNWQKLSAEQTELLETWVRQEAGGLLLIAGSVYMGRANGSWVQEESMSKIQALYPVEFNSRKVRPSITELASQRPQPLDFTREGMAADFLRLEDDAELSRAAWASFDGVYSCFPIRRVKPVAIVLANRSDSAGGPAESGVPYFVTQFYGTGRVFYAGSGEMWRLRTIDEAYFERYYIQLIRRVSQGRLLRGSRRGMLLVQHNRVWAGNPFDVRALVTNAQYEPLEQDHVTVEVIDDQGTLVRKVRLQATGHRPGTFAGEVEAMPSGAYRLELPVPDGQGDRLVQKFSVRIPRIESEAARRDDFLLREIARASGGSYYVGMKATMEPDGVKQMDEQLKDRTRVMLMPAAPVRRRK